MCATGGKDLFSSDSETVEIGFTPFVEIIFFISMVVRESLRTIGKMRTPPTPVCFGIISVNIISFFSLSP